MRSVNATPESSRLARLLLLTLGSVVGLLIFSMMLLTFTDVIGRYFLNLSIRGAHEITGVLLAVIVFGALPLTTAFREHVKVSLFDTAFRGRARVARDVVVALISLVTLAGFAWLLWDEANQLAMYGDRSLFLRIPYAPIAYFMSLMSGLAALVVLALLVNDMVDLVRKPRRS